MEELYVKCAEVKDKNILKKYKINESYKTAIY
jgi:hypothetical protein